ncbi:MAG: tRNA epoxyqueuosine(34) reductase QueG [Puniceicoccales bacterium]|jgi:epoxyqueuosine reductase|nr:tRNA epoxyqueuosine(34) reductase QueG [Puniceicoccales bacterium]
MSAPTADLAALKEQVRALATELGFDAFGATSLSAPLENSEKLTGWLDAGFHGTMSWMERNLALRLSPGDLFPGARAVLLFGEDSRRRPPAGSGQDEPRPAGRTAEAPAPSFRAARYAQGRDYHKRIHGRLRQVCALLARHGGMQRACVDTAPVMEKLLAVRAGLGWQGRSTLLVHPRHGPWLLLGAVFTTLAIPPDTPLPNRCGTCRRCLDACPTGALDGEGALDARRCAAYLTIEHKGEIPEALRPRLGDRLFGCDSCLEACPWGGKPPGQPARVPPMQASPGTPAAPRANPFGTLPPLHETLAWTEADFAARFDGTPVRRLGLPGWLRNACVVLGNTGTPAAIPALRRLAGSAPPSAFLVPGHALWAISRILARHTPG